jgi:1,4-alpha-glucan branching enzyme
MLRKSYSKTGRSCRVTFDFPPAVAATSAALCGDFNNWDPSVHPMRKRKDGRFSVTISLPAGQIYRFKYLLDGVRWENDAAPDGYAPNTFGSEDSLVNL